MMWPRLGLELGLMGLMHKDIVCILKGQVIACYTFMVKEQLEHLKLHPTTLVSKIYGLWHMVPTIIGGDV